MAKLKALVLDIETAPMTAYIWSLKEQYVGLKQLKSDWYVLAWGAKWLGDPPSKLIYKDQRNAKNIDDDKAILVELWKLLNEADIVVTQNGKKHDCPRLNARFMIHGLKPPKPYKHIDTYQLVRRVAAFTSNGLEYLTKKFCRKYKKLSHKKYPGLSLWTECLAGNQRAWDEMRRYNIYDVLSTEEFYLKVRAWAPESMPTQFAPDKRETLCKTCGESKVTKRGYSILKKFKYQRWQCQACGKWTTGERVS